MAATKLELENKKYATVDGSIKVDDEYSEIDELELYHRELFSYFHFTWRILSTSWRRENIVVMEFVLTGLDDR